MMAQIFRRHERLWVFNDYADIHDTWLNRNTAPASDEFYGTMQLVLFVCSNLIPVAWPGQPVIDRRALLVPRNAPPGTYGLYVGLYNPDSGTRLRVPSPSGDTADSVLVGRVDIAGQGNPK